METWGTQAARRVVTVMENHHGQPLPDSPLVRELSDKMEYGKAIFSALLDHDRRPTPKAIALQAQRIRKALDTIALLDTDPQYRWLRADIAQQVNGAENYSRLPQWLQTASAMHDLLGPTATVEDAEPRTRTFQTETLWLGATLPSWFSTVYPGVSFGGTTSDGMDRVGPGYTFVRETAVELRIASRASVTGERIKSARETMKRVRNSG